MTYANTIFYTIILSQILLLSWVFPRICLRRINYVLEHFPPSEYPKLYPNKRLEGGDGMASMRSKLRLFQAMYLIALLIGVGLLLLAISQGYGIRSKDVEGALLGYYLVQTIPFIFISLWSYGHFKLMRQANINNRRTADLRPRYLADFIAPIYVVIAILMFVAFLTIYFISEGHPSTWGKEVLIAPLVSFFMQALLVGLSAFFMYGKKLNPHQAHKDRAKYTEVVVKTSVFGSIFASSYLIFEITINEYGLSHLDPIMMSIFFQLVMAFSLSIEFNLYKIENLDFEVYREESHPNPVENAG